MSQARAERRTVTFAPTVSVGGCAERALYNGFPALASTGDVARREAVLVEGARCERIGHSTRSGENLRATKKVLLSSKRHSLNWLLSGMI